MAPQKIRDNLAKFPTDPGIYMMKSKSGKILYVGKAKSIRHRVQSYFRPSAKPHGKTGAMLRHVKDVEYIVTANVIEALILENNLIKKHLPRYNIKLKDNGHYPYLKITVDEPFPSLQVVRNVDKDSAKYFGPYIKPRAMRQTIKLLAKIFPIRTCELQLGEKGNKHRPCLDYHIKCCDAPCADHIDTFAYKSIVKNVVRFLSGDINQVVTDIRVKMELAAEELNFELAAKYRDQISMIKDAVAKQNIDTPSAIDEDVVGIAYRDSEACVQVMMVRDGKLLDREHYFLTNVESDLKIEALTAFIQQYYENTSFIPKTIILPNTIEMPNTIGNWLSEKRGSRTNIHVPQRGRKHQLVEMATKNARLILDQKDFNFAVINDEDPALLNLQKLLGLPRPPQRIEGFDISNLGERFTVASMVVMENGEPKKSEYRHFKIRGVNGQNDYASMREVISRRFRQTTAENRFPDLILIDGGKGQLNSAYHVLKQLGLAHFPIIGLAKRFERVYLPEQKDPIVISREDPTLHLIQRIRDEAHRFALHYHRKLRVQNLTHSVLDDIPLVGKKRKKVLLRHFRSIDEIRNATIEKLLAVETINRQVAENIHKHLSYM